MENRMESSDLQTLRRVEEKVDRLSRLVQALADALVDSRMIDGADFRLRIDLAEAQAIARATA